MYMRDTMLQMDHGIIISFLKAVLWKYIECIETPLCCLGAVAAKLTARLTLLVGNSASGHRLSASYSCLVPITHVTAPVSQQLYSKKKHSSKIRAVVFRHLLQVPFILDNLFSADVAEHNQTAGPTERLKDHSLELIEVANTFIAWYKLCRRIIPGKDLEYIAESTSFF